MGVSRCAALVTSARFAGGNDRDARRRGQHDGVAAAGLGVVERLVGEAQGFFEREDRGIGQSDAQRHAQRGAVGQRDDHRVEPAAQAVAQHGRFFRRRFREDEGEFLAAVATRRVGVAQRAADEIGEGFQRDIAGGVAVLVVDALEVVEIGEARSEERRVGKECRL